MIFSFDIYLNYYNFCNRENISHKFKKKTPIWPRFMRKISRNATEACKHLLKVSGEGTVSHKTCRRWFEKLESGDLDLSDKPRSRRPFLIDDHYVRTMLEQHPLLRTSEIGERPISGQETILDYIRKTGLVWKYSRWVPYLCSLGTKTSPSWIGW